MLRCWWYDFVYVLNNNCVVDDEFACQKVMYMGMLCFCEKLMKNEVVVVELWVNSWLFVVDVVLKHVVDELMPWVSLFVNWWW